MVGKNGVDKQVIAGWQRLVHAFFVIKAHWEEDIATLTCIFQGMYSTPSRLKMEPQNDHIWEVKHLWVHISSHSMLHPVVRASTTVSSWPRHWAATWITGHRVMKTFLQQNWMLLLKIRPINRMTPCSVMSTVYKATKWNEHKALQTDAMTPRQQPPSSLTPTNWTCRAVLCNQEAVSSAPRRAVENTSQYCTYILHGSSRHSWESLKHAHLLVIPSGL